MYASVAAGLRDMCSSASLRNQGFFFRPATRLCVEHRRESRNLGRMVAGLPKKSKVLKHGNGSGNGVAREHVIDVDCGEWYAITTVIGRPFFRSFDDYDGKQSPYIGPVDERGHAMSQKRFYGIVKKIGRSYLGVFCLTFNQLRSTCTSLVFTECTKLGKRMDDPVVMDFASTILLSVKTMRKQYDIHRAARPLDRGIHEKYKGAVDFCGGAYGILKGAVQREREMTGGGKASSAGAGVKEGTEEELRRLRDIEIKERELRAMALELNLMERRQQLQSQAGGSATHEADGHEAGAKRKRATCEADDQDAGVKKKPATSETSDREAGVKEEYKYDAYEKLKPTRVRNMKGAKFELPDGTRKGLVILLGEIKAAYARARARGSKDVIWKRMHDLTKFRNGHDGTVVSPEKR